MSDWGGTNSTAAALNAGLDLEMPGPTQHRQFKAVQEAIESGELSEATIDERVRNILELIRKVGAFENPAIPPEQSIDNPEHRKLIREAASQGLVLLKNRDNVLPLKREDAKGKKIALLGLAKEALIHGGGSASLNAHYRISPWDGLKSAYGDDVEFLFAKGKLLLSTSPDKSENLQLFQVLTHTDNCHHCLHTVQTPRANQAGRWNSSSMANQDPPFRQRMVTKKRLSIRSAGSNRNGKMFG